MRGEVGSWSGLRQGAGDVAWSGPKTSNRVMGNCKAGMEGNVKQSHSAGGLWMHRDVGAHVDCGQAKGRRLQLHGVDEFMMPSDEDTKGF